MIHTAGHFFRGIDWAIDQSCAVWWMLLPLVLLGLCAGYAGVTRAGGNAGNGGER